MLNDKSEKRIRELAATNNGPFYFYDLSKIQSQARLLKQRLGSDVVLYYSLKANSSPEILKSISAESMRADVASGGELSAAITAGFQPGHISFTGPGKTFDELTAAINLGVGCIVVESIAELQMIEAISHNQRRRTRVSFRLTPSQRVNHVGRLLVDQPTQFGFTEPEWDRLVSELAVCKNIEIVGTHCHLQSQILAAENAIKNVEYALEASEVFRAKVNQAVSGNTVFEQVCVGGGFGVPYSTQSHSFDLDRFGVEFSRLKTSFRKLHPSGLLALELGRFVVAESGLFVVRILHTKPQVSELSPERTTTYAIANGGYAQCQIACGVGQSVRTNLPIEVLALEGGRRRPGTTRVSIAGPTCYSQDILANDLNLETIKAGDLVCVKNVGAYGAQFSPIGFLRQPLAREFFEDPT